MSLLMCPIRSCGCLCRPRLKSSLFTLLSLLQPRHLPVSPPPHKRRTLLDKKTVALRRSPRKTAAVHTVTPPTPKKVKQRSKIARNKALLLSQRAQKIRQAARIAKQKQAAARRQKQLRALLQRYQGEIVHAIAQNWVLPPEVDKRLSCQLLISTDRGGVVRQVQISRSSGNIQFDRSAVTAVMKASPLPVPDASALSSQFRSLRLTVRPDGQT